MTEVHNPSAPVAHGKSKQRAIESKQKQTCWQLGHEAEHLLVNHRLGLVIVDKKTIQQGHEDLAHVGHHHHLWLRQVALDIKEMEHFVVGDEAHADG